MYTMFRDAAAFNQPLVWDTSSVTTMSLTFRDAKAFNQALAWDTSKATIDSMLKNAGKQARIFTKYEGTLAEGREKIVPGGVKAMVGEYTVEISWKAA